jgi:hypothetical protein
MARLARRKARKMTKAQRTAMALKMNAARWGKKKAVIAGLLLLCAAHVSGGEFARDAAWIGLAASADLATTRYGLQTCPSCREANPLAQGASRQAAVKLAGTAVALYACRELRQHGHPTSAKWFRWSVVILWSGVAAHNLHVARGGM